LISDRPDHPVLAAALVLLAQDYTVEVRHPALHRDSDVDGFDVDGSVADAIYLLKAHDAGALNLAAQLEALGARIINPRAATEACCDRLGMAHALSASRLPIPNTHWAPTLTHLLSTENVDVSFPWILKSRWSRRGDLVVRIDNPAQLEALVVAWGHEPVVVQQFVPNDGWDHKLWMVGDAAFVARRRTPLEGAGRETTVPLRAEELDPSWLAIVQRVGAVFGLMVYGVDIIATSTGPVVVDVNAFPGCQGVAGAPGAIARLVRAETKMLEGSR
jgi:ribosomal protein S6--L-glutamate ligase